MFEVTLAEYDGGRDLNWQSHPPKFQVSFQHIASCLSAEVPEEHHAKDQCWFHIVWHVARK